MAPLSFLHHGGRACRVWVMPGFRQVGREGEREREREREGKNEGKNFFFPCYASKEEEA